MAGVNKVILIGNFGKDPEFKYVGSEQTPNVSFSLATSESYKDKNGQRVEKTEWHNCVAWRGLADVISKYCHKGTTVYIEGKLQTRSWEVNDGSGTPQKRYTTEIIVSTLNMIGNANAQNNARNEPVTANQGNGNQSTFTMDPEADNDLPF